MATYASLTVEQKSILADFSNLVRAWTGEQARTNNHADAINSSYNAQVSAILGLVDSGEVIPNASGLAGAASLTQAETVTLVSHLQNILTDMSSHVAGFNTDALRQTWAKAAGASNLF